VKKKKKRLLAHAYRPFSQLPFLLFPKAAIPAVFIPSLVSSLLMKFEDGNGFRISGGMSLIL